MKKIGLVIVLLMVLGTALSACSPTEAEAPATLVTASVIPMAVTTNPPLPTNTNVPPDSEAPTASPTATRGSVPANQQMIDLGSYQIEFVRGWIAEDYTILDKDLDRDSQGMLSFPIRSALGENTLILIINLLAGDPGSFSGYICQLIEPDGRMQPVERIEENQGQFFWLVPVASLDPNLIVSCPDGELIELSWLLDAP